MAAPQLRMIPSKEKNIKSKQQIEAYQKKIAELMKDPRNAKKAAMLIENLLKKK